MIAAEAEDVEDIELPPHESWTKIQSQGPVALKRKAPSSQFPETTAKKPKFGLGTSVTKNAVVALNEYKAGLKYELVETRGPVHLPCFVFKVTVNNQTFTGEGKSKKLAKQAAAETALKNILQFKNPMEAQAALGLAEAAMSQQDFTSDCEVGPEMLRPFYRPGEVSSSSSSPVKESSNSEETAKPGVGAPLATSGAQLDAGPEPAQVGNPPLTEAGSNQMRNPVMILNELRPGLDFSYSETGQAPCKKFFTRVTVEEQEFEGSGASKKSAKQAVAKAVLMKIYKYNFSPLVTRAGGSPGAGATKGPNKEWEAVGMSQEVADNVGRLVNAKYDQLMEEDHQHRKRKVIAGIVMSRDEAMEELEVVAVSTGTKCVSGEYMSVTGTALNDCHAEIISRRCLIHFLYSELEALAKGEESTVLEESSTGGYRLRPGVRFHLYINTAPCGDARIFSPHEAEQGEEGDRHPNRRARGQLRTKIESGEGTIPVKKDQDVQTWDGVLQGARLLTMSCSDKLARWNLVGLQGALLSAFLEPIFLHSIVLGSLFHPTHMYRAVAGRLRASTPDNLPTNYKLHTPRLNLLSSREVRNPTKAPNHSVNWTLGQSAPEVVDAMRGKQDGGAPSRLCKLHLFRRWLRLAAAANLQNLRSRADLGLVLSDQPTQYEEAKGTCRDFQAAKQHLFKAFKEADLGVWVEKPMEQDEFEESVN